MIIKNGIVFQDDYHFAKRDLYIQNGRILRTPDRSDDPAFAGEEVIDAEGLYVLPGLIDVHSHGAVGSDFSDKDPEGLRKIRAYEYAHGITSYCPTSMSLPKEDLWDLFSSQRQIPPDFPDPCPAGSSSAPLSRLIGFHMEGPFLDETKKGAHRADCLLAPDVDFFRKCNAACGNRIRLITVSPNRKGAMEFIEKISREAVVSLGHTNADYEIAREALQKGARHVTHLFNAMSPFDHREPGLIGAAAEAADCYAELICDGIHLHESAVRAAFRLMKDRIVLISDSMRATGMPDGVYDLGGQQVLVKGSLAALPDGTIAGSVTNLYDGMCKAVSFGIPLEEAVAAASANPAKSIGIYEEVGSLSPGKKADVLLVDPRLRLVRVLS